MSEMAAQGRSSEQERRQGNPEGSPDNSNTQKKYTKCRIPLVMYKSEHKSSTNSQSVVGDSNYGSFGQTSVETSSSLSFSGLSSDFSETSEGTSQCSSNMSFEGRQRKRDKVKEYLRKLKFLLPSKRENKKESSTVFALRQALNTVKQTQDGLSSVTVIVRAPDPKLKCTGDSGADFPLNIEEIREIIKAKQGTSVSSNNVLAIRKGTILHCSTQLEELLGYPKGYLRNHALRSLVHLRDEHTVSFCCQGTKTSSDEEVDAGCPSGMAEGPREIYFRLQCFKGLRHGFSIRNSQYLTLHATITLASKTVEDESAETKKKTLAYYILNCSELQPAYKVPMEVPDLAIFSTRHSTYCLYTYMHPSSIQYLGYLPQDVENTSIFDLYHPGDMMELYNMYEEVVKAGVGATRSKPYRLRVKNSDYITVETTWSCFVDPWTKKLEFLVGQHKVLRGPQHLDIFASRSSTALTAVAEVDYFKKKIKDLFAVAGKSIFAAQKMIDDDRVPMLAELPTDDAKTLDSNSPLEECEESQTGLTKVTASYSQVSYSQVIRNFLMACPQTVFDPEILVPTISMISKKLLSTSAKGVHYDENTLVPVAILSVKPPSVCSSTKALLSEPEAMSPNPAKEMDAMDDTVPQGCEVYKPTLLTKSALRRHTKQQEQQFLQQMTSAEAKELRRLPEPCENVQSGTKRPHESDECNHAMAKRCRSSQPPAAASTSWDYQPMMEYSELNFAAGQHGDVAPALQDFPHLSCSQCMMGLSQHPPAGMKPPPIRQSSSTGEQMDVTFIESPSSCASGISSPTNDTTEETSELDISVSSSLFSLPSMTTKRIEEEDGCMAKPLYWPGRIMTVPAWLTNQNWNDCSIQGYKVPVQDMKTVLLKDGQWLDKSVQSDYIGQQLNTAVGEHKAVVNDAEQFFLFEPYQLPMLKDIELSTTSCSSYESRVKTHPTKHKIKRLRSKNDLNLNKVKMELIKSAIKEERMYSGNPIGPVEKSDSGEKCDSGVGTGDQSVCESFVKQAKYEKELDTKVEEHQSAKKLVKGNLPNTESKCYTESNSSNNDHDSTASGNDRDSNSGNDQDSNTSSNERDLNDPDRSLSPSNSKGEGDSDISSGLTPSDQRSTGEVNSSLKESDEVSNKESGSTHSNSDCKPSTLRSDDDAFMSFFSRLFVPVANKKPLLRRYSSINTKVHPWLNDIGLNKKIEMEYTMESKQLGDVLDEGIRRSSKIEQSEMVRSQLDEFLEDVMKVGQVNLCQDAGNQEKTYTELLDLINPSQVNTKETYWTDMGKAMEMEGDMMTQGNQSMQMVMNNKQKVSDQENEGSKSSSSGSGSLNRTELLSSNKVRAMQSPNGKQSVCSKSTRDSGIAGSMTGSSSKDSGQDKESSCSFKRSDEESSDTGRGRIAYRPAAKRATETARPI